MENCQKNKYSSTFKKFAIDIRGASVMFVRGIFISSLWSFQNDQNQCPVNTLCLIDFEYFQEKTHVKRNKMPKANLKCTCRFTRLQTLDIIRAMSRTNNESHTFVL